MNNIATQFRFLDWSPGNVTPFLAQEVMPAAEQLLALLEGAEAGTTIRVDLTGVRIGSAAVRALLRRPMRRIIGGDQAESPFRYLVLTNVGDSWDTVDVTLRAMGSIMVAYCRPGDEPELLGKQDGALTQTYAFVRKGGEVTAKDVMEEFALKTIAAASNRLATLIQQAVVRRVSERPTGSGGKLYVYGAVT